MTKKCIVPWTQMEIGPLGHVRPCCEYTGYFGNINDTSIAEIWNGDKYKTLRQDYLDDRPPVGCVKCQNLEKVGIISRRLTENENNNDLLEKATQVIAESPTQIDFKLGNICNIKCRICSSINSHAWRKEEQALYGISFDQNFDQTWVESDSRWNQFKSMPDTLTSLLISGGEPLLIKKNFEFLKYCIENGRSKVMTVRIVTNGTVKLTDEMISILQQFKMVVIMYSIDDIGPAFDYQRYPANWKKVEDNFLEAMKLDFIDLKITFTASIFNVLSGHRFTKWCNEINFPLDNVYVNFLTSPDYFNISMLEQAEKDLIIDNLTDCKIDVKLKNYMLIQYKDRTTRPLKEDRKKFVTAVDRMRGQEFKLLFPVIDKILKISDE
jgi:radical SAM protein with 4Fe4S-binding SPASM domain